MHHGWHGTHRYDIQVLATHASTWVHRYSSWSVPLGKRDHVGGSFARNARCTVTTELLVWYSNTQNNFSQERPFAHYMHSHRLATEMWTTMKNKLLGKKFLSCSFYLYRFRKYVSYGFPIINFCNPGVHYETPCINLLKPAVYVMHQQFNIQQLYTLPTLYVFMCFVFIWEQTATCASYSINWLVFITEMKSVYSAVRTGSLNKRFCSSSLKGQGRT